MKCAHSVGIFLLGLAASACAAPDVRQGQSGAIAWEVVDKAKTQFGWTFTILLRETAGVGIPFNTVQAAFPLPPTGGGMEWYGGIGEHPFVRRLDPRSELRETFIPSLLLTVPQYADLEFRGVDDAGRAISVPHRVYLR
jgi:hypothetical protein